jgi:hypothetical protein
LWDDAREASFSLNFASLAKLAILGSTVPVEHVVDLGAI